MYMSSDEAQERLLPFINGDREVSGEILQQLNYIIFAAIAISFLRWKVLKMQGWALKMHTTDGEEDAFAQIMMQELCGHGVQSPRPIIPRQHHHTALYQPPRIQGRIQTSSGR